MPIYIKEEMKTTARLQRSTFRNRAVDYIELTLDSDNERLDVKLYQEGAVPAILAQLDYHTQINPAPDGFHVTVQNSRLSFFKNNQHALNFLLKIDAISVETFNTAFICRELEKTTPLSRSLGT